MPAEDHPIHMAAENDDVESVRELLERENATLLNRRDDGGRTPLHRAVKGSAHDVITLLLDRGADIGATDGDRLASPRPCSMKPRTAAAAEPRFSHRPTVAGTWC